MDEYIRKLAVTDPLTQPAARMAIESLNLPQGSSGLDAGCGIGLQAFLLARAVGPEGRVTGLDLSRAMIDRAKTSIRDLGLDSQVAFKQGDADNMPFVSQSFDWAWSANCVGYASQNPVAAIKELARVVKPGGIATILIWSSQMLLPGYPELEARLNATKSGIAPFPPGGDPGDHPMRALAWFREAGLEQVSALTFAHSFHAPLNERNRKGLEALIDMRWEGAESELDEKDRDLYLKLCTPGDPDFILNAHDYYAFFTYSQFSGRVPDE